MAVKQTITPWVLRTEALRVSRKHVKALLRSKGIRESSFSHAELQWMAKKRFEHNREAMIGKALGDLAWARLYDTFRKVELMERTANRASAGVSAIRKSAVQKEAVPCE